MDVYGNPSDARGILKHHGYGYMWTRKLRVNGLMTSPQGGKTTQLLTESCASEVAAPTLFPVKGGTRCKDGGEPKMASTQLTTMYWPYAREMSH